MKMIECIRKILDWKKDSRTVAAFLSGSSFVKRRVIHIIRHPCNPQFSSLRERSWAVHLTSILGGQSQNHIVEENRIKLPIYWCLPFLCSNCFFNGWKQRRRQQSPPVPHYFNLKGFGRLIIVTRCRVLPSFWSLSTNHLNYMFLLHVYFYSTIEILFLYF